MPNDQPRVVLRNPNGLRARYDDFIGGRWVAPVKRRYFTDPSPIDGGSLAEVARSSAEDVELALDAAHAPRVAWGADVTHGAGPAVE